MVEEMKIITGKVNELLLHKPSISERKSQVVSAAHDVKQKVAKLLHAIDIKTEYLRVAKIIFEVKNYLGHSPLCLTFSVSSYDYPSTVSLGILAEFLL